MPRKAMSSSTFNFGSLGRNKRLAEKSEESKNGSIPTLYDTQLESQSVHANTVSGGSNTLSRLMKAGSRLPDPNRTEPLFSAVEKGLKECIAETHSDVLKVRNAFGMRPETEKHLGGARQNLEVLNRQLERVQELQNQYASLLRIQEGTNSALNNRRGSSGSMSSSSIKATIKETLQHLMMIEKEFENVMGYFVLEMKGVAGFARICPGDQFEMVLKYGTQRWKSRGKIDKNGRDQKWDPATIEFPCTLSDVFELKASELKGFTKSALITDKRCDISQLYSAFPQLMTISLNRIGTLKLNIMVSWSPMVRGILSNVENPWSFGPRSPVVLRSSSNKQDARRRVSSSSLFEGSMKKYPSLSELRNDVKNDEGNYQEIYSVQSGVVQRHGSQQNVSNLGTLTVQTGKSRHQDLGDYLVHIRTLAQRFASEEAELQNLVKYLSMIERLLKPVSPTDGSSSGTGFDCTSSDSVDDTDDLDDNIIIKNYESPRDGHRSNQSSRKPGVSSGHSNSNGHESNQSPYTQHHTYSSESLSRKAAKLRQKARLTMNNQSDPQNMVTNGNHYKGKPLNGSVSGSVDSGFSAGQVRLSSGSLEIDLCLRHHLIHCDRLLKQFAQIGPLKSKQTEAQYRLATETECFFHLMNLARNPLSIPSLASIMKEMKVDPVLEETWRVAIAYPSRYLLLAPSNAVMNAFMVQFGAIVERKYPDLVEKVFDKLIHILTDSGTWESEMVTMFQFVLALKDKHLPTVIESLAHETWIVQNLCSGKTEKIKCVIERLKQVPVPPPPDCLKHVGILLTSEHTEHANLGASYLKHAQGSLREDLVTAYMTFLEEETQRIRAGACKALASLKSRRSIGTLIFVFRNDSASFVRSVAKDCVLSFGEEGAEMLGNAQVSINGFESIRI